MEAEPTKIPWDLDSGDQHRGPALTLLFSTYADMQFFSQLGYVYVFKGKSGCNLCCLTKSDSPFYDPVVEGPIPCGDFHEDRAATPLATHPLCCLPSILGVKCTGWFCVNLTQAGVIIEKGASLEEMPP